MALVTPDQLREAFPEFASSERFPTSTLQLWLTTGYLFLNADRWGAAIDLGVQLFAMHNATIERRDLDSVIFPNGVPGEDVGPVNSKSVDKVSLGFDVQGAIDENSGHWALSTYGTRFIRIARMMGSGGLQLF